jgi:hypothetical protein
VGTSYFVTFGSTTAFHASRRSPTVLLQAKEVSMRGLDAIAIADEFQASITRATCRTVFYINGLYPIGALYSTLLHISTINQECEAINAQPTFCAAKASSSHLPQAFPNDCESLPQTSDQELLLA